MLVLNEAQRKAIQQEVELYQSSINYYRALQLRHPHKFDAIQNEIINAEQMIKQLEENFS